MAWDRCARTGLLVAAVITLTTSGRAGEPVDSPAAAPPPTAGRPPFSSSIAPLDDEMRRAMTGVSHRKGCPVPLDELRHITLVHHVEGGATATGALIVHRVIADDVVAVFRALYDEGFVVSRMEPIERYGGSDDASMRANNTSAFNCREMTGKKGVYSLHAYGLAIDVNPLVNPYVKGARVLPEEGALFVDRTKATPGMIRRGDATVRAFRARGFTWGGDFRSLKDWQHFEKPKSVLSSSIASPPASDARGGR